VLKNTTVALVLLKQDVKENGEVSYSVLCHDPDGAGWQLPYGDEEEHPEADYDYDANSNKAYCCIYYLEKQTCFNRDHLEFDYAPVDGVKPFQWLDIQKEDDQEHPEQLHIYYGFIDEEKWAEIEEALSEKKGNAKFISIEDLGCHEQRSEAEKLEPKFHAAVRSVVVQLLSTGEQ